MLSTCLYMLMAVAQYFRCETRDGKMMRLSELPQDRLTLLVFYDPDCTDCRQELFGMKHSGVLRQTVREGRVQVLGNVFGGGNQGVVSGNATVNIEQ